MKSFSKLVDKIKYNNQKYFYRCASNAAFIVGCLAESKEGVKCIYKLTERNKNNKLLEVFVLTNF